MPIKGWGSRGYLLPTERKRYSTRDGAQSVMEFPSLPLPEGEDVWVAPLPIACWLLMHVCLMSNMLACRWREFIYITLGRAVCYLVPENEEFVGLQDGSGRVPGLLKTGLTAQTGAQSPILLIPTP